MSLVCDITGKYIMYGEPLMVATRNDVKFFSAISKEIIDLIPETERETKPCNPTEGGVNIHKATGTRNFNGVYNFTTGFKIGEFLFSISQEVAELFLSEHMERYKVPQA